MIFGFFTLLIALCVAGVAAWFSLVGLMAIFSASAGSIAVMAGALEIAKLVTASWLYRHWHVAPWIQKLYLSLAVMALMLITSMGIFGYLSKAHLEQQASVGGNNEIQIESIHRKLQREHKAIQNAETAIAQLDSQIDTLVEYDKISGPTGAVAVRQSQAPERLALDQAIQESYTEIERLETQLLPLQKQLVDLEVELGPLKYVAQLVYGDTSTEQVDQAVRLFIILLVLVFDPLAVMLVVAANQSLMRHGVILEKTYQHPTPQEPPHEATTQDSPPEKSQATDLLQSELQELRQRVQTLDTDLAAQKSAEPEVREVEKLVEVRTTVMINDQGEIVTDDLDAAVDMWIRSNSESQEWDAHELRETFMENEQHLKNPQGFWAIPLPKSDHNKKS